MNPAQGQHRHRARRPPWDLFLAPHADPLTCLRQFPRSYTSRSRRPRRPRRTRQHLRGRQRIPPYRHPSYSEGPCPVLLRRRSDDQRKSFLRLWNRLPLHLRDITFDLHGSGWSSSVILFLRDVLCDFPTFFLHLRQISARAPSFRLRSPFPRTARPLRPVRTALIPSLPKGRRGA